MTTAPAPPTYKFLKGDLDEVRFAAMHPPPLAATREQFAGTRERDDMARLLKSLDDVRSRLGDLVAYLGCEIPEVGDGDDPRTTGHNLELGAVCGVRARPHEPRRSGARVGRPPDEGKKKVVERVEQLRSTTVPTPWKGIPRLIEKEFGVKYEQSTLEKYLRQQKRAK